MSPATLQDDPIAATSHPCSSLPTVAKAADVSTIRLLLADRQQGSLGVYTDSFQTFEPLESDDAFDRDYVVHGDGEYANNEMHVNTCDSGSLPIEVPQGTN